CVPRRRRSGPATAAGASRTRLWEPRRAGSIVERLLRHLILAKKSLRHVEVLRLVVFVSSVLHDVEVTTASSSVHHPRLAAAVAPQTQPAHLARGPLESPHTPDCTPQGADIGWVHPSTSTPGYPASDWVRSIERGLGESAALPRA